MPTAVPERLSVLCSFGQDILCGNKKRAAADTLAVSVRRATRFTVQKSRLYRRDRYDLFLALRNTLRSRSGGNKPTAVPERLSVLCSFGQDILCGNKKRAAADTLAVSVRRATRFTV